MSRLPVLTADEPAKGNSSSVLEAVDQVAATAARTDKPATPPPTPSWTVVSERTRRFREEIYPGVSDATWNDWRWQLRNRIRELPALERVFQLTEEEREAVKALGDRLPVGITPYYASILDREQALRGLRRTMIPVGAEFERTPGEAEDPLAEDADMPVPGLVHRYPDRVLFLVTNFCATYCRYCTRSRLVGKTGEFHFTTEQFEKALASR